MPGADFVFDEERWRGVIQKPDWYKLLIPYIRQAQGQLKEGSQERSEFNKAVRKFLQKEFEEGRLALASFGPDLDEQRQPVDTIVIHHTSARPGYSLGFMNITQLLNIYAPYYFEPRDERDESLQGRPIWSNHFRDGRPSFLAYHWLMRMDGSFERLLDDNQIGWHAGNWDVNTRSIGICLDNDYENQDPDDQILRGLAVHIKRHYPQVKKIIGHCEARTGTACPGTNFIDGWKNNLLSYLS